LQTFYDENASILGGAESAVLGALKTIDESLKWHEEHKEIVVGYLLAKSSAALAIISPLFPLLVCFLIKLIN